MRVSARLTLLLMVCIILSIPVGCKRTVKGKFIPTDSYMKLRHQTTTKPVWAIGRPYKPYDKIGEIKVTVCLGNEGTEGSDIYSLAKEKMLTIAGEKGCDAIVSVKSEKWKAADYQVSNTVNGTTTTQIMPGLYFRTYTGVAVVYRNK
jgi:hypothetical protein